MERLLKRRFEFFFRQLADFYFLIR